MKRFIRKYITSRPLWMNMVIGISLVIVFFLIFILSLNWITHHGVAKTVPSVTGKNFNEVQQLLEDQGFEVIIQDSVYYDSLPPLIVIKQVPEPDAVVKVNRTIYVTVNRAEPPEIDMPNLVGYSLRNAEMVMKNMGLRLGDTTVRADFAKGSVLEQLYNGITIAPGTKIRMGSIISLVIGGGVGNEDMRVPKLVGLSYEEARVLLESQGLLLGAVLPDPLVRDTSSAFVYWQNPKPRTDDGQPLRIRPGQMIDIRLSVEKPVMDTTVRQLPPPDEENDY